MHKFQIKQIQDLQSVEELCTVFSDVFGETFSQDKNHLLEMLENEQIWIFGASSENKIIGGAVLYEMSLLTGSKELYLYDIAVHPNYQQQGIGALLIKTIREIAKTKGISILFVEAEEDDTGAVAFYRKLAGTELAVRHFNFDT